MHPYVKRLDATLRGHCECFGLPSHCPNHIHKSKNKPTDLRILAQNLAQAFHHVRGLWAIHLENQIFNTEGHIIIKPYNFFNSYTENEIKYFMYVYKFNYK